MNKETKKLVKKLKNEGYKIISINKHIKMRNETNKTVLLTRSVKNATFAYKSLFVQQAQFG